VKLCWGRLITTRLLLVRHGESHANVDGILAGARCCRGLTDLGREQAAGLRERWQQAGFRPDVVRSSPVLRAVQTAAMLTGGAQSDEDCAACEVHLGDAEGLTWAEYKARFGDFYLVHEPDRPFATG